MPRLPAYLLSALLAAHGVVAQASPVALPDLGDTSLTVISPAQERKLGEELMRKARRQLVFLDDAEVNDYVQQLGQRLVSHSDNASQDFRFFVVSDPSINAFAMPGGFIGVHTGLILAAQSEAELASVLAHEIAHITQRHIPRMLTEAQRTTLPAMAALLGAILLAGSGQQGGEAAIALTTATLAQKGINFTRSSEEEADRIGVAILAEAGLDPRAMPSFFERMQSMNRHNETNLPEFLRTHPVTTSRIADSRDRAERYTYRQVPDSQGFLLTRAKIRALAPGDPAEIARGFAQNLAEGKHASADAERYGYALALLRARQYGTARAEARKLTERHPNEVAFRMLAAEVELSSGRTVPGLRAYADAYRAHPSYPPLARNYGRALLRSGRARDAEAILRAAIKQRPDDPVLYELLAQAAGEAGRRPEAHQAMAEHYYLNGNPGAAIEQLQLASRYVGDNFYLQASLEARIQAIREELALYRTK